MNLYIMPNKKFHAKIIREFAGMRGYAAVRVDHGATHGQNVGFVKVPPCERQSAHS